MILQLEYGYVARSAANMLAALHLHLKPSREKIDLTTLGPKETASSSSAHRDEGILTAALSQRFLCM